MANPAETISLIFMGVSLSACAGLRAFLPLAAISLMAQAGQITLAPGFEWLGSWQALAVFGLAAILEIMADKYPGVDHVLDAIGLVVKPLAGALLATSLITGMDPLVAATLGIITGGVAAGTLHVAKSKLRLASTALTGGLGNPVLSFVDDGASVLGTVLAFAAPVLSAVLVIGGVAMLWRALLRHRRRKGDLQLDRAA
jgi:hypothetical protein